MKVGDAFGLNKGYKGSLESFAFSSRLHSRRLRGTGRLHLTTAGTVLVLLLIIDTWTGLGVRLVSPSFESQNLLEQDGCRTPPM